MYLTDNGQTMSDAIQSEAARHRRREQRFKSDVAVVEQRIENRIGLGGLDDLRTDCFFHHCNFDDEVREWAYQLECGPKVAARALINLFRKLDDPLTDPDL